MKRWLKFIQAGALACAGAAVLAVLFVKTQTVDLHAHTRVVDAIRSEQHLNALLKHQVLSARFGLLTQYDPLTKTVDDIRSTTEDLDLATRAALATTDDVISAGLSGVAKSTEARALRVERFKSENSILRNSLYYLPLAGDSVLDKLAPNDLRHGKLAAAVNRLIRATLVYSIRNDGELRREQLEAAAALRGLVGTAGALEGDVQIVLAHSQQIEHKLEVVNRLIGEILADDVEARVLELDRGYGEKYADATARADTYRIVLYCWSVLMLAAALFAGLKLRQLYRNLERLVAERTHKLDEAVRALWGEMKLARKIQTALLPSKPTLQQCDVATAMQPADEVGGDYYDIFTIDGHEWVLIGDVSGHGVPAGLVMMMCQTAVRTALHGDPGMDPDRLLATVNRALTENIDRLGEDKYVTITAMRRDPDGVIHYAGLHQDMFVHREADGLVEDVRSSGVWLGIADEISPMLRVKQLELGPGDTLLLYTDGVTEARRDGRMLDNDGLRRLFQSLAHQSAEQIVAGILSELGGYDKRDDVALVVIKQRGLAESNVYPRASSAE